MVQKAIITKMNSHLVYSPYFIILKFRSWKTYSGGKSLQEKDPKPTGAFSSYDASCWTSNPHFNPGRNPNWGVLIKTLMKH